MSESTCIEHERADCKVCASNQAKVKIALAKRAFAEGFARGADPDRMNKRHTVNPATHHHYKAGHDAATKAAAEALDEYVRNEGLR